MNSAVTDICVKSNKKIHADSSIPLTAVEIQYPNTADTSRQTKLYKSKLAALTALYRENGSEFDRFCTYNPREQTIFVDLLDNLVPDFATFDRMGCELIWIPAFNQHTNGKYPPSAPEGSVPISERQGSQQSLSEIPFQPIMKPNRLSAESGSASLSFTKDDCLMMHPEELSDPGTSDFMCQHSEGAHPCDRGCSVSLGKMSLMISEILLDLNSEPLVLERIPTWGELAQKYREKHKSTISVENMLRKFQ